jgi:hypothetical protein
MLETSETFHAYLDETENTTAGHYLVGGFVTTAEAWREIEEKWLALMPPSVKCFHTTACFSGNEDFKDIDIPERVALLDKLTDLIASSPVWLISYGIDQTKYKELAPKRIKNDFLGNRYAAVCGGAVERACTYMGNVPGPEEIWEVLEKGENWEKCAFFIEDHQDYRESAKRTIQSLRTASNLWFRSRIGADHYGTKSGANAVPLLQVADFGIFLAAKHLANAPDGKIAWSGYFNKLKEARRVAPVMWANKDTLEKLAKMVEEIKQEGQAEKK